MRYQFQFPQGYYRKSLDILETSLTQLSVYKPWREFDPGVEYPVDQRYAALPALTKRDIRQQFPLGFVTESYNVKRGLDSGEIHFVTTSGSTDISLTNIWNQSWWDASERASWKLNAHAARVATGEHPEAILANPRNVGFISDNVDLAMEKRCLSRFLYLNEKTDPVTWSSELMDRMIRELAIFQPVILEANPSLLAILCRYAANSKKEVFQPALIVLTYEYPSRMHYRQIKRVFNVPIASSYGTTETGYVFMQCEEGRFHQNTEFCRVDFQPLRPEHGGPQLGRILVTTFNNHWYYMVRFDVGDLVRIDESGRCSCGRNYGFLLSAIEGRFTNATLTCDGRLVTLRQLDDALSAVSDLDGYRLEQLSSGVYVLYVVSRRQDKDSLSAALTVILHGLYGKEARVLVVHEKVMSPEDSGKYCLAKTLFPLSIEQFLDTEYTFR